MKLTNIFSMVKHFGETETIKFLEELGMFQIGLPEENETKCGYGLWDSGIENIDPEIGITLSGNTEPCGGGMCVELLITAKGEIQIKSISEISRYRNKEQEAEARNNIQGWVFSGFNNF